MDLECSDRSGMEFDKRLGSIYKKEDLAKSRYTYFWHNTPDWKTIFITGLKIKWIFSELLFKIG